MNLFSLVPLPYRILAGVLGAIALLVIGAVFGANYEQGQHAKRDLASTVKNSGITAHWAKGKDDALAQQTEAAQINDAAAGILADTVVSLRSELATSRANLPNASLNACRAYAATLNAVFGECAASDSGLAKEAAGHALDSLTYQRAWPK